MAAALETGWRDRAFRAFAHPVRRTLLCLLRDEGALSVEAAAARLARGSPLTATRVETALRHNHLPMLRSVGFVAVDDDTGTVRYTDHAFVEALLDSDAVDCRTTLQR